LNTTIQPPRDVRRPIFDVNFCLNKNFAAIPGSAGNALSKDTAVKFGAETEAIPTFALAETDASKAVFFG
jgi:hypothetical protein